MYMKIAVGCMVLFVLYYTTGCNNIVQPRKPLVGTIINAPPTPEEEAGEHVLMAKLGHANSLDYDASVAFENKQYAKAEALERNSLSLGGGMQSPEILAQSLEAQGKDAEAINIYRSLRYGNGDMEENVLLPYALLMLKTNKWTEAVAAYNKVMKPLRKTDLERIKLGLNNDDYMLRANCHFSPSVRQPKELASAIHIGLAFNGYHYDREQYELNQFSQAVRISPDFELARKYYDNYLNYLKQCSNYNPKFKHPTGPNSKDLIRLVGPLKGYGTSL